MMMRNFEKYSVVFFYQLQNKNVAGQFIELSALDSIDTSKLENLVNDKTAHHRLR
jgi:hypothetical protein